MTSLMVTRRIVSRYASPFLAAVSALGVGGCGSDDSGNPGAGSERGGESANGGAPDPGANGGAELAPGGAPGPEASGAPFTDKGGAGGASANGVGEVGGSMGDAGSESVVSGACAEPLQSVACLPDEGGDGLCEKGMCVSVPGRFSEGLSVAQSDEIAGLPDELLVPGELILPDGTTLDEWISAPPTPKFSGQRSAALKSSKPATALIANMELCFRRLVAHPGAPGTPPQTRLAYVWGSRDTSTRHAGREKAGCCEEKLLGVDCSGMVLLCAWEAGAKLNDMGADGLRSLAAWQNNVPSGVKVVRLDVDGTGRAYRTGDLVFWESKRNPGAAAHMGVISRTSSRLVVLQSNGVDGCDTSQPDACTRNYGDRRGPREVSWSGINDPTFKLGPHFDALRIINEVESASVTVDGTAQDAGWLDLRENGQLLALHRVTAASTTIWDADFETEQDIELTATALPGSGAVFIGWSGPDCAGAGTAPTLTFAKRLNKIECTTTFECPSGESWNATNKRCEVTGAPPGTGPCTDPATPSWNGQHCEACPQGTGWDALTNSCAPCPTGTSSCGSQCVSTACSGGQIFVHATCSCGCPVSCCGRCFQPYYSDDPYYCCARNWCSSSYYGC